MAEISPLRQRMIEDLKIRNLSAETQRSYVHHVSKFSRHFGRSPDKLGIEDIRAYQMHLVERRVSWGSLNQAVCALKFFYGVTLGLSDVPERIPYAREPRKLPVVLSPDEVVRFLEAIDGFKNRIALTTTYAAGLRVSRAEQKSATWRRKSRPVGTRAWDRLEGVARKAVPCAGGLIFGGIRRRKWPAGRGFERGGNCRRSSRGC